MTIQRLTFVCLFAVRDDICEGVSCISEPLTAALSFTHTLLSFLILCIDWNRKICFWFSIDFLVKIRRSKSKLYLYELRIVSILLATVDLSACPTLGLQCSMSFIVFSFSVCTLPTHLLSLISHSTVQSAWLPSISSRRNGAKFYCWSNPCLDSGSMKAPKVAYHQ